MPTESPKLFVFHCPVCVCVCVRECGWLSRDRGWAHAFAHIVAGVEATKVPPKMRTNKRSSCTNTLRWHNGDVQRRFAELQGPSGTLLRQLRRARKCDNYNLQTMQQHVSYELSGYVGQETIFSWMFTIECCLVVGLWVRVRIRVRIRFRVWLVSCYANVFVSL